MSEGKGQNEPSMEDILASIRRIVAEDGGAAAPMRQPGGERHDEILELTEMVGEDGTVVSIAASGKQKSAGDETPQEHEQAEPDLMREPMTPAATPSEPEPPPVLSPQPTPPQRAERSNTGERLVSNATAAATAAAFSQLTAYGPRSEAGGVPLGGAGRTLEELVRELLRPMLKDWLDANLPPLVERVVKDEIQYMVRNGQGR
jgi:uncharacterized protein